MSIKNKINNKKAIALFVIACSAFNPSCKIKNEENLLYEMEKKQMIERVNQRDNFSKLLIPGIETVNGKRYTLINNFEDGIINYTTEFSELNFFDTKIKKTGEAHLTANSSYAYAMYENGDEIVLVDTKNDKGRIVKFKTKQTNISLAAIEYKGDNGVYLYSKESGLIRISKELVYREEIDLEYVKENEGEISSLFLNKSSKGLMVIGDNFNSIYFIRIEGDKVKTNSLKLHGLPEELKKPRIVEYNKKFYIKNEEKDYVFEFDYDGNFIRKMEIPDIDI